MTEEATLDMIEAMAAGQMAEAAESTVEEDDVEQEEAVFEGETEEEQEYQDEPEEEAEEKPKMSRASQRVKQAVDRANELEQIKMEQDYKINELMKANEQLMAMVMGEQKQEGEAESEEILDDALKKQVDKELGAIKTQQFNMARNQELAQIGGEQGEVFQKAIASVALEVMQDAEYSGKQISDLQAEKAARALVEQQMQQMHERGVASGAIAAQIARRAQYYDAMAGMGAPNNGQPKKNSVNMKKVEEARERAGAPNIDKEAVSVSGTNNPISKATKAAIDEGLSPEYLRKWGLPA